MDFEFLAYLNWREMLIAIVVLLVLYILTTFLRINRLRNETQTTPQELSPGAIQNAVQSYAAIQESEALAVPADAVVSVAVTDLLTSTRKQEFAWNEPPPERPELRRLEVLEQDLAQLRREIGGLRAEVQAVREEQRREISKVQVAQTTSPFYNDAVQLATQGREAADISVLCGISRAEAELVVALARNKS
jgi:hypothetical protein